MSLPEEILKLFDTDEVTIVIHKSITQWVATPVTYGTQVIVPITHDKPTEELQVAIDSLNVRATPTSSGTRLGAYPKGTLLSVYQEPFMVSGDEWRKLASGQFKDAFVAYHYNNEYYLVPKVVESPIDLAPLTGDIQIAKRNETYRLSINGDMRPTFGVNIRELAYPDSPGFPYYRASHIEPMLAELKSIGVKWVRFFTPHKDLDKANNIQRVGETLDLLHKYGLRGVVCLMDSIGVTKFAIDQEYHTYSSLGHLNMNWYRGKKWQDYYSNWVKAVVSKYHNHPALGMWQLCNEPTINQSSSPTLSDVALFTEFVDETSTLIYSLDTTHPISIGAIASIAFQPANASANWFSEWLKERKYIHVVSVHSYQKQDHLGDQDEWEHEIAAMRDLDAAQNTHRVGIVDEFGSAGGNRINSTDRFLQKTYIGFGGQSCLDMQWAYMWSNSHQDFGIGDGIYGWDDALPPTKEWYAKLRELYQHWIITNLSREV